MDNLTRDAGQRRRTALFIVIATLGAAAVVAACSSSSAGPAQLGGTQYGDAATEDHTAPQDSGGGADVSQTPDVQSTTEASPGDAGCVASGDAAVSVSPASVVFGDGGLVGCGTQAQPASVTITNQTCQPFTFTTALSSGTTYFTVAPSTGTVAPGVPQTLTINPNPVPQTSAVTPDLYEGNLSITTTAPGDAPHNVQLHETAYGAILVSTQFGNTLAFGGVSIGETGSAQFSVSNTGNAPTTISFAVGSPYFGVSTADGGMPNFALAANQSVAPEVTFSPQTVEPYNDVINTTVAAGTPLCATPPATIPLTGQGTTGVSVQPTNLDFGNVQCGQPAAAYQTITISNTGAAITYTPTFTLGSNSPYTLADSTGAALTPGDPIALGAGPASATIRIVPKQITNPASTAADGYADTLTITTTGAGDAPHNISLHETAQGAIFTLSPQSVAATQDDGLSTFVQFSVNNTGNYPAGYTLATTTTQGPPNTFTSNLSGGTLGANSTETGTLTCVGPPGDPPPPIQYLGTMTLTPNAGTVLCADPPPAMPLSVTN